jgi:hypothetical protein
MTIGLLLWESLTVVIVVIGALGIFLLRSWFSRTDGEIRWALWLRFSALLFGAAVLGLMEGVLLSQYGFVWFLAALGVTLFLVAKFAPKLLKQ